MKKNPNEILNLVKKQENKFELPPDLEKYRYYKNRIDVDFSQEKDKTSKGQ